MLLQLTTSNATKANANPWDLSPKELEIIDLIFSVQVPQTIIVGHFDVGHIKEHWNSLVLTKIILIASTLT